MRNMLLTISVCLVVLSGLPAHAQTGQEKRLLQDVEEYLNSITTAEGTFRQLSSNGGLATGRIFISRPGKIRFEYDHPQNLLLLADGKSFIYYDMDLGQITYLPLKSSIAGVILRDNLSFSDEEINVEHVSTVDGNIRIVLSQKEDPLAGKIILVFSQRPLKMLKWQVIDAQQISTTIILENMTYGEKLDRSLFEFNDPRLSSDYKRRR